MKFLGIYNVGGFRNFERKFTVSTHPALVFEDEKGYYFINYTSEYDLSALKDVLRYNGKPVFVEGKDVMYKNQIITSKKSLIMATIAFCTKESVLTKKHTRSDDFAFSSTEIKGKYKLGNYKDFLAKTKSILLSHINQMVIYDATDDDWVSFRILSKNSELKKTINSL